MVLQWKFFKVSFQNLFFVGSLEDIPSFVQMHFCSSAKAASCAAPYYLNVFTAPMTTVIIHNILLIFLKMYFRYLIFFILMITTLPEYYSA